MSNDVSIFTSNTQVAKSSPRVTGLSTQLKEKRTVNNRRIQVNINGTFKKVVNGDQVGEVIRGEFNAIIVDMLPGISRIFYKEKFDPKKEATLPNCWSNLGDTPEEGSVDKQSTSCLTCKQNIKGSGENGGRACRYQRRLAVLLAGDTSGDIYQMNIPAKSLFGKGLNNAHPFESYINFLLGNGEGVDDVVTNVAFDANADTMELVFTPMRHLTEEEYSLLEEAKNKPEAKMYTSITVAQTDGVKKLPKEEPKIERADEPEDAPEDDVVEEPQVRQAKKKDDAPAPKKDVAAVVDDWLSE